MSWNLNSFAPAPEGSGQSLNRGFDWGMMYAPISLKMREPPEQGAMVSGIPWMTGRTSPVALRYLPEESQSMPLAVRGLSKGL